ncbi:MAG TPA: hypothetical protein VFQ63_00610 [Patescibacteria group bacterium]|nr:hypothetical protein [Patescibacteria group bacterium]
MIFPSIELILFYLFLVFVVPRFIVPNYGFTKSSLPSKIPQRFQEVIEKLTKESSSQEEFLKKAYDYITTTYEGGRFKTFVYFYYPFLNPFRFEKGFAQCNIQNYLLRTLLVRSKFFTEEDIRVRVVFLNFFTHQYLQVRVGDTWLDIDPHAHSIGISFGKRAFLFA